MSYLKKLTSEERQRAILFLGKKLTLDELEMLDSRFEKLQLNKIPPNDPQARLEALKQLVEYMRTQYEEWRHITFGPTAGQTVKYQSLGTWFDRKLAPTEPETPGVTAPGDTRASGDS